MDNQKLETKAVNQFSHVLRKNWFLIVVAFLCVVISTGLFTLEMKPVYEATATIFVRQGGGISGQIFDVPIYPRINSLIKNHVSILKSRNLATKVIHHLQQKDYCDSLSIFKIDTTKFFWEEPYQIVAIPGDSVMNTELQFRQLVQNFMDATSVSYGIESDIIELKGRGPTPWEATCIVNAWIDAYQEYERSDTQEEVIQTKTFLEKKLKDIERKLEVSENELSEYQKQNKLISLTQETSQLVTQAASFESLLNQTKTDLEAIDSELYYQENQLDQSRKNLVKNMINVSSPVLTELQRQMAGLIAEKAAYEAQLLGAGYDIKNDAKLIQMENRLQGIKNKIIGETKKIAKMDLSNIRPLDHSEKLISNILELRVSKRSLLSKMHMLQKIIDQYNGKLKNLPDKSRTLVRLEREVQVNNKIYVMIREKYEEARIREAGQIGLIRVVDRAILPISPIRPKIYLNMLLGVFFGILFGISIAFVKEHFKDSVNSYVDIESLGIKIIGGIPAVKNSQNRWAQKKNEDLRISRAKQIFPYLPNRYGENETITESYRAIRTSIYFHKQHNRLKTILFTSPGPSEGKSTTVTNLAIAMAHKGVKTLLVDSDLRQPVLDLLFISSQRKTGLTNQLNKKMSWQSAVRETAVKNLYLLAAGPSVKNASELLGSKWMARFIQNAKKEFSIILFDSPPMLPVTDATILSSIVDGVVMVIRQGKTAKRSIRRSIELIKSVKGNLLGIVVTGVQEKELYGYRYYYKSHRIESNRRF